MRLGRLKAALLGTVFGLLLTMQQCTSENAKKKGFTREDLMGSWYMIDSHSNYWELFYSDSLFWGHEFGPGLFARKYEVRNDSVVYTYLSGDKDHGDRIILLWEDSAQFEFEPGKFQTIVRLYPKIDIPITDKQLLEDDTVAFGRYLSDYMKRSTEQLNKN